MTHPIAERLLELLEAANWYVAKYESDHCCNTALELHGKINAALRAQATDTPTEGDK